MLRKLERKLGRFAIPHLILFLVAGQAGAAVLALAKPEFVGALVLVPERVLQGEVWRVVSFLFIPPATNLIFLFFALYILFLFGRALEEHWGEFRFNLFIFIGWIASVGAAFLFPRSAATNVFLMESLVFAFAYLNPDFEIRLFFFLPVKMKWIALLTAAMYVFSAYAGGWPATALAVAGVLNFFLFFGRDMWVRVRGAGRRTVREKEKRVAARTAAHTCAVCGITDLEDPTMQFRYCSQCDGARGYCTDHIRDHEHVKKPA